MLASLLRRLRAFRFRKYCEAGAGTILLATGRIHNQQGVRKAIAIGSNTWVAGELLVFEHSGRIHIGDYCYIGDGARIWSAEDVTIGDRVFVAHGVNIHDNDAHSPSASERHRHFREVVEHGRAGFREDIKMGPIVIEDDAWIGFNSSIMKGVRLGKGSIVGACSVVTRDVAPYTIVAGNPAMVIGQSKA